MCRVLAYIGPEIPLEDLLLKPENSLINQTLDPGRHPQLQLAGWGFGLWSEHLLKPEEPFHVHIIGMMNTADRSLAVIDYALRRRFGFFEMPPGFDSAGFRRWQQEAGSPTLDRLVEAVVELNVVIGKDPALGQGFAIGHSFLSRPTGTDADDAWLYSVVEDELVPLLDEYWFDEPAKAQEWAGRLRAAVA